LGISHWSILPLVILIIDIVSWKLI